MASAGAQCEHVNHVTTQLPYAIVAAWYPLSPTSLQASSIRLDRTSIAIALMVITMLCDPRDKCVLKEA